MTITEICAKARGEGWRFEYDEHAKFIWAIKDNCASRVAVYVGVTYWEAHDIDTNKLGQAIAAAMNGEG